MKKQQRVAMIELSAGCLQEAVERLHRMCPRLSSRKLQTECTEVAHNIAAQIAVIQNLVR